MTRVAIIGGGIGGLTAALALHQAGTEVAVYEAAPELKEIGAGVALHPNAMRVLRALGLEEQVRAASGVTEYAATLDGRNGRVITRTSREQQAETFGLNGATLHRADLLDILAAALPPDLAALGKRCLTVDSDGPSPVAKFTDGTEVEADVIIGADGIHSAVRGALFGPDDPRFTGKICYRSVVPAADVAGEVPQMAASTQWLGPHGTIVLYPLRGTELVNIVAHYDDENYRHESWIAECDADEVLERYAGWHEPLLRLFAAGKTWYKWALYDRDPIPAWTRGRVTLLGDAAHPMLPYLGQGACQAIEDGAVLATALGASDSPGTALGRYERTRRPRASRVVLTARERGLSNHLSSPWAAWRRDLTIAVRRRLSRRDPEGRGGAWLAGYDATSRDVLSA
ncbi:MAG: FAD-dependent monooxygenase [Streptosporangiales bacterium]|nr:FAD-dependent monooxygenase [Streptosporangiales bacterium]